MTCSDGPSVDTLARLLTSPHRRPALAECGLFAAAGSKRPLPVELHAGSKNSLID